MSRHKDKRVFLLGTSPTPTDKKILGSKLPTVKQVLLAFLARHDEMVSSGKTGKTLFNAANDTIREEVLPLWEKARVPTSDPKRMIQKLLELHKDMMLLKKIPENRRERGEPKERIDAFKEKLSKTMSFKCKDAEAKINIEEDRLFLHSMETDRQASMSGADRKLLVTEKKVSERRTAELKRKCSEEDRKARDTVCSSITIDNTVDDCDGDADDQSDQDMDFQYPMPVRRKHRRQVKTGQELFIPPNILKDAGVVSCATRNKVSPTVLSA